MLWSLLWILAAAVLSFGVAAVFSTGLKLGRNGYLLVYISITIAFVAEYYVWSEASVLEQVQHSWICGLLAAGVAGFIAVRNVLSQPSSPRMGHARRALDVAWAGVAYGLVDGILLSVFPVIALHSALSGYTWSQRALGQVCLGTLALFSSLLVTLVYHLGYTEFRNRTVLWTLVGNGIFSLAFIVSGNPLAAVLPHIAMHVAAVLHGPDTSLQLPPHARQPSTPRKAATTYVESNLGRHHQ